MKLYTLFDAKASTYLPPFLAKNDEVAKRDLFTSLQQARDLPIVNYPADFTLFALADWDPEKGPTMLEAYENLGTVLQILHSFRPKNEDKTDDHAE